MAETDGTPRFRKSKPPKGANGSGAPARNSRPGAKARKRAALRDTLPSGSALEQSEPSVVTPAPTGGVSAPNLADSVVKTTMPTVIRQDPPASARAEAHDMRGTNHGRSTVPLSGGTPGPQPRTIRSALGSTLRMELTVHKGEGAEPQIQLRTTAPLGNAGQHHEDASTAQSPALEDRGTRRDNFKRSRKSTTQGFAPAFPDPSAHTAGFDTSTGVDHDETLPRGGELAAGARTGSGAPTMPSMSTTGSNANRPRRPRRPGERTLIMTRRPGKKGSKRDWVFVVLLVAALGLTASMFLSQQAPTEEVVDAAAYDETQDQEDGPDPFAPTTLRPWAEREQAKASQQPQHQSDTRALTAREPSGAANSVQATELRSQPAGAEVVAGNAVVGSTPVRVARGSADMVYVLRLTGHESKIVRVGPNSPPTILVDLMPLAPPPAVDSPTYVPAATSGTVPAR